MVRYLTLLNFTEQGARDHNKSTARAAQFRDAAAKVGVRVEGQYWTTGRYDGALMLSAENETDCLRCLAALAAAGNVRSETLRAFDAEDFAPVAAK